MAANDASPFSIRPVRSFDYPGWRPLWDGYNAFYGREGATALPEANTKLTWKRFLDPADPIHALVAVAQDELVGLAHYLFHRSTTRLDDVCYLQDLFTAPAHRGRGIGRTSRAGSGLRGRGRAAGDCCFPSVPPHDEPRTGPKVRKDRDRAIAAGTACRAIRAGL